MYLSRTVECPLCKQPVHDGDHEALFTRDAEGTEVWVMTGHRACIQAEVTRRNRPATPTMASMVDRITGRPATIYTPPEDCITWHEWVARLDAVLDDEYANGPHEGAGGGCGS